MATTDSQTQYVEAIDLPGRLRALADEIEGARSHEPIEGERATKALPVDLPQRLRKRWAMTAEERVRVDRALDLLWVLLDYALELDEKSWRYWRELASGAGQEGAFKKPDVGLSAILSEWLSSSSTDPSIEDVRAAVNQSECLIKAVLLAVSHQDEAFAKSLRQALLPENIQTQVQGRVPLLLKWLAWLPVGLRWCREIRCWRRYVQAAEKNLEADSLRRVIQENAAKSAAEAYRQFRGPKRN